MKQFLILGAIVDTVEECMSDDVCPSKFNDFVKTVDEGEDVEILVNSVGGSVTAGISIANSIRMLLGSGHKVTAIVQGLAASIASVIVCACETVKMYQSSFMMIHNCWSIVQGNSTDLRREADTMDKMNLAIMSFYKGKFDLEESEIKILMDNETWFSGSEASAFCFKCDVMDDVSTVKIAAKLTNFKNVPKALNMNKNEEIKKEEEIEEVVEETTETVEETKEEVTEETPAEEKTEEPAEEKTEETVETVEEVTEETEEKTEDTCKEDDEEDESEKKIQARVSGMQSKMQQKINALTKDFTTQLQAKDTELNSVKAELTSLKLELENTKAELQKSVSAVMDKENALAVLNANVLKPMDNASQVDWHNLKGKKFFDYLKEHKIR